jgi:hypothetical protein
MAPSSVESRLARLRAAIKSDLDKLPDLPPKPEATPEPKVAARPAAQPARKPEPDPESSDDSEAGCEIEFTRVYEEEKVTELSDTYSDDGPTFASTMGNGMQLGQVTAVGQAFCAIFPFSKFPYRYIPKSDSERVADKFFNAGKFFMREWDL